MTKEQDETLADAIVRRDQNAITNAIAGGADPNADLIGTRPLHLATIIGCHAAASQLLQRQADPNAKDHVGRTPLHYAAMGGMDSGPDIIESLVEAGADVNASDSLGCTPLDLAAGARNRDTASSLHRHGGSCKQDRRGWVQQVVGKPPSDRARG